MIFVLIRPCQLTAMLLLRSYPGVRAGPQFLHRLHQTVREECCALQDQDLPCQGNVDQSEGCRHPQCKSGQFCCRNVNSDPPWQGDHSHDSGLVEGFVSQLRQRKLKEGCEEVSKSSRELWSELRAEVLQQSGQAGETFLGNKVVHF